MNDGVKLVEIDWIDGMTGYYAGSDGRIYSAKNGKWGNGATPRALTSAVLKNGYAAVAPRINGKNKTHTVHSLVCRAFNGHPMSTSHEVRHLDGDRLNCAPENLEWGTRTDNMGDSVRLGRTNRGPKCPMSKLTEDDVRDIRSRRQSATNAELANEYGVSKGTIGRIQRYSEWSWFDTSDTDEPPKFRHQRKLNREVAKVIREKSATMSVADWAHTLGVSKSTIYAIINNEVWREEKR